MQSIPAADPGQAPTLLAEDAGDTGRILLGVFETLERAGLRGPFRADSVRSISNPIPLDQVAALARLSVEFPPLRPELWLG